MIEVKCQPLLHAAPFKAEDRRRKSAFALSPVILRKRTLPLSDVQKEPVFKRSKLRKSVRFSDENDDTECHYYTKEDVHNAWYCQLDYSSFTNECRLALRQVDAVNGKVDRLDSQLCMRGLEDQIVPQIFHFKRKRKKSLIQMVMCQHEMHKTTGNVDASRIRAISVMFSRASKEFALDLGALDAADANGDTR
jgi:hypothetical protein